MTNNSYLKSLSLGLTRRTKIILQTESSECGLACLAMIASYHGYYTDLFTLRQKHSISQKGATLARIIAIANSIDLQTRPIRLDLKELNKLRLPCILHWDMNHFVVLTSVSMRKITILDPALGERSISMQDASKSFTGVALELWTNANFEQKTEKTTIDIFRLFGGIKGIWRSLSQVFILALVLELFSLVTPLFMQWVIDHVILSADINLLTTLVIGFGLLMLLNNSISLLQSWIGMYLSTTLKVQWKSNIFNHLLHLPTTYFQKRHLGDVVSRFSSIDAIQSTLTTTFLTAILDGLMTIFTLTLMFMYSPSLSIVVILSLIIYAALRWIWYIPLRRATEEQIVHAAQQSTHFMESMRGIKAIKRYDKQEYRQSSWLALFVNQVNARLKTQKLNLMFQFTNGIIFGLENLIVVYLGASFVIEGEFTVGVLIAFLAYKSQFGSRVSSLIDKYVELKMLNIHGERLADIVLQDQERSQYLPKLNPIESEDNISDIKVKNISFKYSEDEEYILKDISLYVKDKESVAIVGETGCGKSTLMSLMIGELKPSSGEILIAGKNFKNIAELNSRKLIACVAQDDVLFAGSLLENISFFDEGVDMLWATKCAKLASIHDEIMSMPMEYQTLIGDMGSILSGGQKQRIFIARALYQRPKILFLDEATSHLDVETERKINNTIKSLNITRVFIAHRPETINSADRVISLKNSSKIGLA
ncbi:peptidase domain-containing ABC transporter [Psychrobacter fozii]|uniref:Colicin V processing peptidase n=1 Tax=Psychrobacter fozii TaxID=198480 RepID=A0A2V4V246_9GAMM|nr:peptidase domain-containing ABC transporter [Psychrobacter fozii]PYE38930.1 colicin V processing peptidase [Psychrobacter fozii]